MQSRLENRPYQQACAIATGAILVSTIRPVQHVWLGRGAGLALLIIVLPTPTLSHSRHTRTTALAMRATVAAAGAQSVRSVTWATTPLLGPQCAHSVASLTPARLRLLW